MRAVFVAIFLAVLSTSFAVKLGNQQKSLDLSNFKLESNDFLGDAIKGLLQVTLLPETQEVYDIIYELREELRGLLSDTETNYNNEKDAYTESRDNYESTIKQLDSDISTTEYDLGQAQQTEDDLETAIKNSQIAADNAQDSYDTESQRRSDAAAAHKEKIQNLEDAIAACEEALRLMGEVREKDLPARTPVLLQTSAQKIKGHIQMISEKLSKMTLKSSVAPFIKTLAEITEDGVNWELIDKIIELIKDLKESLGQEIIHANQDDEDDAKLSGDLLRTFQTTIDNENESIRQNSDLLTTVQGNIRTLEGNLKGFQDAWKLNTDSLEGLNRDWATKSSNYDAVLARLRKDIEVLGQALQYLNDQN